MQNFECGENFQEVPMSPFIEVDGDDDKYTIQEDKNLYSNHTLYITKCHRIFFGGTSFPSDLKSLTLSLSFTTL